MLDDDSPILRVRIEWRFNDFSNNVKGTILLGLLNRKQSTTFVQAFPFA